MKTPQKLVDEVLTAMGTASDLDAEIKVLDAEGYRHTIKEVVWDPEEKCYWIRTDYSE